MKKVEDLFIVDVFQEAQVIAGRSGLNRPVESIEVSETPDVKKYLKENALLVTTGYAFKDNPKDLCALVDQLSQFSCAGMAIKLKRFIEEIPQEVLDLADSLEFPIIVIPSSLTLGNVAHQLLSFLWNDKTEELFYAIHVHKKFTEMMFKGYNLHSLIENLGYFLHCPVLLLNPLGDIASFTQHFHKETMRNVKENIEAIFKSDIEKYREKNKLSINNPNVSKGVLTLSIFHVKTMHPFPYFLLIFNPEKLPYPSSQLAIEQASTVISFTLLKNEAINESSRLLENNFFGSLVDGNINSRQEIIHRGKMHGLLEKGKYLCIVFKPDEEAHHLPQRNDVMMNRTYDFLYDLFNRSVEKMNINSILFMKDDYFVLIIQSQLDYDNTFKNSIRETLEAFQEEAAEKLKIPLSFGLGNFVNDVANIPISYSEAVESYKHGAELFNHSFISFYETKQLKELVRLIPDESLQEFYENTLRGLAYPKNRDEEDLVNTLIVYLDYNCQIALTAKKLFIHRNTVKYRIAKCEEILGFPVHEPQNSLHLRMALLMRPIFTKALGV
ncbi:PucR family transcriptional regulator [Bacillus rubiinfantis]|uniref:PucR family transcriptional regulator n=1 Tax=Bacillus rubiinfantis TaxID=1499680 RepID=UPI0005A79DA7|nr:PucR family transcriptional regulator [Bacillus rubiinfantis]